MDSNITTVSGSAFNVMVNMSNDIGITNSQGTALLSFDAANDRVENISGRALMVQCTIMVYLDGSGNSGDMRAYVGYENTFLLNDAIQGYPFGNVNPNTSTHIFNWGAGDWVNLWVYNNIGANLDVVASVSVFGGFTSNTRIQFHVLN